MGCLAAQFVASNKKGIGGFYITSPDDEQEYNYQVRYDEDENKLVIKVDGFEGTPDELLDFKE